MKNNVLKMALAITACVLFFFAFACKSYTGFTSRTINQRAVILHYGNLIVTLAGTLLAIFNAVVIGAIGNNVPKEGRLMKVVLSAIGAFIPMTLYFSAAAVSNASQKVSLKMLGFLEIPVGVMGENESLFVAVILPLGTIAFAVGLGFPYLVNRILSRKKGLN